MKLILNTREAAEYLGVSPRTLEKWRWIGAGPPYSKLEGRVIYRVAVLDAWMDEKEVRS